MTDVCSLRDRGEREARDVFCTRPGPWGNPYTVERYGWRALDLYRADLHQKVKRAADTVRRFGDANQLGRLAKEWLAGLAKLAGARLLCACPSEGVACHVWLLAEVVEMVTGVPVRPAPGRERW